MNDYESLKELASETGRPVKDLLVLAPQNDPFYCGSPAQREQAEWFKALWDRFEITSKVHIRRVHYRITTCGGTILLPNGKPYQNDDRSWDYLSLASKAARYLGLVDPLLIVDHRNPDPKVYAETRSEIPEPDFWFDFPEWTLPQISVPSSCSVSIGEPSVMINGYDYERADQQYILEVWCEKSTMNDVLEPLCQELGANLITSVGFQSISSALRLLHERMAPAAKPARVFYISDFDPAGAGMPVAVARQLQYWKEKYGIEQDVKLIDLVLTAKQVKKYQLPRIPIKDKDLRKASFEERNGEGAVELDALEALFPGELARIIRKAMAPYMDRTLRSRLYEAEMDAEEGTRSAWSYLMEPYRESIRSIESMAAEIAGRYTGRLEAISSEMEEEIRPLREEMETLRQAIREEVDCFDVELPPRPEADPGQHDESGWLFDSTRSYMDQLEAYRAKQDKGGRR